MARLKTYTNDNSLSNDDRLFGTDGAGGLNATSNFTLGDLKQFIAQGVDVVKKTPKLNIPAVNEGSSDVESSTLRLLQETQAVDIEFYNTDPGTPVTDEIRQINLGQFVLFNSGDGWYLEIKEFRGKFSVRSFIGKSLVATAGVSDTIVTFDVGALEVVDDKDYIIDADNDVIYRFELTRTGDLETTWANLVSSRSIVTELKVRAADNDNETLDLITLNIDGAVELGEVFIEALDTDAITFNEGGEGITFEDASGNGNSLTMDADGNFVITSIGDGSMIFDTETEFKQDVNVSEDATITLTALDDDDTQNVVIDNSSITYTNVAGESATIEPVIANDSVQYRGNDPLGDGLTDQGVLTQLQVGDNYWNVPSSLSQVAQILPGLSENLSPVPDLDSSTVVGRDNFGRVQDLDISGVRATPTLSQNFVDQIGSWGLYTVPAGLSFEYLTTDPDNPGYIIEDPFNLEEDQTDLTIQTTIAEQLTVNAFIVIEGGLYPAATWEDIAVGDVITIHDANGTESDTLTYTTTSNASTVTFTATDGFEYKIHIILVGNPVQNGTAFNLETTDPDSNLNYEIEVNRITEEGSIQTGQWFYGIDEGTFVEFKANVAVNPGGINLAENTTSLRLASNDAIHTAFQAIPTGERLFFVDSDNDISGLAVDAIVPNHVYEVVNYIHDDGTPVTPALLTFSLIGSGNLIISTPTLTFRNLPDASNSTDEFLVIDSNNRVEKRSLIEVAGGVNQVANYENSEDDDDAGLLQSFEFLSGPNNHNVATNGGGVTADITGRIPHHPNVLGAGTEDANVWTTYVLGNLADDETGIVRLPATTDLVAGAVVKIVNLSQLDAGGNPIVSETWSVLPSTLTGDRIMRTNDAEGVILNAPATNDFIWSGDAALGWIIQ